MSSVLVTHRKFQAVDTENTTQTYHISPWCTDTFPFCLDSTSNKLTWVLTSWGCDPSITTSHMSSPVFSRLQHHESTGGQRESARKQRPALGRCWRREPRWRPGPGHASSDSCVAQPQISPLPAHAYASPPAAHAPPAGRSHCAQCGCRVLIFSATSALLPRVDWLLIKDYFWEKVCARFDSTNVGTARIAGAREEPWLDSNPHPSLGRGWMLSLT